MEKGFIAQFERKVLFRISRFVAFSICFLLFLSLVGGALYLVKGGQDQTERPDPTAVAQSLKPAPAQAPSTTAENSASGEPTSSPTPPEPALFGVKLPPILQEQFLTEENQRVLRKWLDDLPDEERQPFIDGLAKAVEEARKIGVSDADAINRYQEQYADYVTEKKAAEAAEKTERLYVVGAFVSTLMLLALFSLVLVLLAIERNTRLRPADGATA